MNFSQTLTGGVLLLRNKYYIVMYRGKDFLPPTVAAALTERQEMTKQTQDAEEKVRGVPIEPVATIGEGEALAGTLAEFYEAQARWGREISVEEREKMKEEASRAKTARVVKRLEHKLAIVSISLEITDSLQNIVHLSEAYVRYSMVSSSVIRRKRKLRAL